MTDPKFEFEKDLEIDVDVDLDLEADLDLEIDSKTEIDIDVKSDIDLDGNSAELFFDVEAIGDDTAVIVDVAVLTVDNELSSISGFMGSYTD